MRLLHGIAVSPGIAHGTVYLIEQGEVQIPKYWLHDREIEDELKRYDSALEISKGQLLKIKAKLVDLPSGEHLHILEGHLAMLDDMLLTEETPQSIRDEKINAEWALTKTQRKLMESFSKIDEDYFRERRMDIIHVIERIQKNLLGKSEESFQKIDRPVIVVARDLSPADLAHMPKGKVIGFVTDVGGRTSHTGIVAASMEIPAVVGTEQISRLVCTGDTVIIDGIHGVILINPTDEKIREYETLQQEYLTTEKNLIAERELPAETIDHHAVTLAANMELIEEIPFIKSHGATGIGLYRTEFLFLESDHVPTEKEQYETYAKILKEFNPFSVTMRTYDLGGEKGIGDESVTANEANPALGLRAIRFCLQENDLFRQQLRAMLRASVHGNLRIMFPMISGYAELAQSRALATEIMAELTAEKLAFNDNVQFGIMIETPAAAMIMDILARHVDFFSVGTNDLIQYTLAVDRVNEHVAYLYNPMHPAILRMLRNIIETGRQKGIPVNLCGEMASDPLFLPVLVALGFDELSMNAVVLPRVKHILRSLKTDECEKILQTVYQSETADESLKVLHKEMKGRFPEYFD